jgi:ATP-binding cassette subfamily F protein 3
MQANDVLLLDEPTNHLDIDSFGKFYVIISVLWLLFLIRCFLDNVTNRTIEISLGKAYDFNKPYSQYLELRHEIRENNWRHKNQKKK